MKFLYYIIFLEFLEHSIFIIYKLDFFEKYNINFKKLEKCHINCHNLLILNLIKIQMIRIEKMRQNDQKFFDNFKKSENSKKESFSSFSSELPENAITIKPKS